jgi:hypothetical protein
MGDALEIVLQRHREIWRERLWWTAVIAGSVGAVAGYATRWIFG